ncbi:MAG: hypothetical protein JRG84_10945 [Deltaproteobacteria bacterium]|nr:hypothetical protein [Deltaproteobacteria bacterium]
MNSVTHRSAAARLRANRPAAAALLGAWLVVELLLPGRAEAIDPALCSDDGVTKVPDWVADSGPGAGRDSNECLNIDPGNGDDVIPFQYEQFDKSGISIGCGGPSSKEIDHKADEFGECRTKGKGKFCTILFWNIEYDNYRDKACKNEDILFYGSGNGFKYWYFKDSKIINGWKCSGGGWSGPNGIGCSNGENSNAHADGIQARGGQVSNGGWMIMQDSYLANAGNALGRFTNPTSFPPQGSFLFQGLKTGIFSTPLGLAKNWQQDCRDRDTNDLYCTTNKNIISYGGPEGIDELWFVDVSGGGHGGARFQIKNKVRKIVIVNTGCGSNGCNGEVEYTQGWPWPIDGSNDGPGNCPNGRIKQNPVGGGYASGGTYCYTSLENARDDRSCSDCPHKMPPFVHLSATGWENPPEGVSSTRPMPVNLE